MSEETGLWDAIEKCLLEMEGQTVLHTDVAASLARHPDIVRNAALAMENHGRAIKTEATSNDSADPQLPVLILSAKPPVAS